MLVEIGLSKIKNETSNLEIGNGLIATTDIPKGSIICYYSGILVDACDGKK
jgi:hypothetical protein